MNKKREYLHYHHHIEIIAIIVVIGLFFIGGGITGLHMFDFKQGFCDDNSDCESTELCCFFYEESHGICGKQIECSGIERLTKEEKQSRTNFEQPKQEVGLTVSDKLSIEHPSETAENYFLIVFGALVLIGIIVYIVYHKYFKGKKQHTMIKRKKSLVKSKVKNKSKKKIQNKGKTKVKTKIKVKTKEKKSKNKGKKK